MLPAQNRSGLGSHLYVKGSNRKKSSLLPTNHIFMKPTETWYFWLVNQLLLKLWRTKAGKEKNNKLIKNKLDKIPTKPNKNNQTKKPSTNPPKQPPSQQQQGRSYASLQMTEDNKLQNIVVISTCRKRLSFIIVKNKTQTNLLESHE